VIVGFGTVNGDLDLLDVEIGEQRGRRAGDVGAIRVDLDDQAWGRFVYFSDPDGNSWAVQQLPRAA
jgi:uncharacterized glyoxalase superfamily protein PhnB